MAPGFICSGATSPGMTSSSPVEKSATRGPPRHLQPGQANAGGQPERRRGEPLAPGQHDRAAGDVLAAAADPLPRRGNTQDAHGLLAGRLGVFLHHHRVGAGRDRRAGEDAGDAAGRQRLRGAAGGNALADRQGHAFVGDLAAAHGIAVHRAVVLRRHLQRGHEILRQHAAVASNVDTVSVPSSGFAWASNSASASSSGRSGARGALMNISPGRSRSDPHCRPAIAPPRRVRSNPAPAAGWPGAAGPANRWRWPR